MKNKKSIATGKNATLAAHNIELMKALLNFAIAMNTLSIILDRKVDELAGNKLIKSYLKIKKSK
jgi:hypothetical protein